MEAKVLRNTITITREEFEDVISSRIAQAEMLCENALDEAGINVGELDGVFLVGGSTRMPYVQDSVRRVFKQEPIISGNVDEVVALGAALYAALRGDQAKLSPTQKLALQKVKVADSTSKCFGTISVNYDTARGAERLANTVLIQKGQKVPCSVTESFYTVVDDQRNVRCQVTESGTTETDPRFVNIIWEGDLPLPSGRPAGQEIAVKFTYDENQMLRCEFVDVATGNKTPVELHMASGKSSVSDDLDKFLVE